MPTLARACKIGRKYQNPVPTTVGGFRMMLKALSLFLTNREERIPRQPLGPFFTDSRIYRQAAASGLRITWMGHSSLLLEIDSVAVLIDPVWDPRASPTSWFGPKRFFAPPLPLVDLPAIDIVLVSHDHYDHLGKATVQELARLANARNARWVTSLGVGSQLRAFGVPTAQITELDWTESLGAGDLTITALPARHFSGRNLRNRFETLWSSFVLKSPRHNLYYGADSGLWDGFSTIAREYGPFDLTMLEVGAFNELWKSIHLGPDGAADAFTSMGAAGLLMPIHWGLFNLALHGWRQPIERIVELADSRGFGLWTPEPGAPTEVVGPYRSSWWLRGAG